MLKVSQYGPKNHGFLHNIYFQFHWADAAHLVPFSQVVNRQFLANFKQFYASKQIQT